ncbi:L-asparaginase, type II, partial [gut metagenome]
HTDDDGVMVRAAMAADAQGIVHAGTGNGSIHEDTEPALFEAVRNGLLVVRASRVHGGSTVEGLSTWQDAGFIPAGSLNPQKARVLLQLILTITRDPAEAEALFRRF